MRIPAPVQPAAPELKMTAMIDVVFLLLIFFIWTSNFEIPEFDLPSMIGEKSAPTNAQQASPPEPMDPLDELVITLRHENGPLIIQLNGQRIGSLAVLQTRLSEILALGVQPAVVIDPAAEITMNVAVAAYDAARAAGADRVLFAVASE